MWCIQAYCKHDTLFSHSHFFGFFKCLCFGTATRFFQYSSMLMSFITSLSHHWNPASLLFAISPSLCWMSKLDWLEFLKSLEFWFPASERGHITYRISVPHAKVVKLELISVFFFRAFHSHASNKSVSRLKEKIRFGCEPRAQKNITSQTSNPWIQFHVEDLTVLALIKHLENQPVFSQTSHSPEGRITVTVLIMARKVACSSPRSGVVKQSP